MTLLTLFSKPARPLPEPYFYFVCLYATISAPFYILTYYIWTYIFTQEFNLVIAVGLTLIKTSLLMLITGTNAYTNYMYRQKSGILIHPLMAIEPPTVYLPSLLVILLAERSILWGLLLVITPLLSPLIIFPLTVRIFRLLGGNPRRLTFALYQGYRATNLL